MGEDAGGAAGVGGVFLAQDADVVGEGELVGGVVVQHVPEAVCAGLDPPDAHVVGDAEVPCGVDGAVGVVFEAGGEASFFA